MTGAARDRYGRCIEPPLDPPADYWDGPDDDYPEDDPGQSADEAAAERACDEFYERRGS